MRWLVGIFWLFMMLASPVLASNPPITLDIYPHVQQGPGTIRVTLVIPRDTRNRAVCISIEGDTGYSRSSCWDHGEGARYQTVISYPDLPAGTYAAQATLVRTLEGGEREEVRTPLQEFHLTGFS